MKKKLFLSLGGVITTLGAVVLLYFYVIGLDAGGNVMLFVGSLVSLSVGVFSFIIATKQPAPSKDLDLSLAPIEGGGESRLQKNNEMVQQYNKTAKAREELRMMELAGNAGKES